MDAIRDTVIARAETLGVSAYAIAKACELDPSTVVRYLNGKCSLNSCYVSLVCMFLDLELRTKTMTTTEAYENGYWIFNNYISDTNADWLHESEIEVFSDWPRSVKNRPRLGAIHKDDRTGGFAIDMPVRINHSGQIGAVVKIDTKKLTCDVALSTSRVVSIPYAALSAT